MSTNWVVTAAAERVALDKARTGETTFTVTNPRSDDDRAVFDPVAGDNAEQGWFVVDEPQRPVRGGASVSYLMKVAVPAGTPPGEYAVQGRVYSAESAPEESSVLSPRVMLEVPGTAKPDRWTWPWWGWLAAAGLAVVLLVVIGVLLFRGGDDPAETVMPNLVGMPEQDAVQALVDLGITLGSIEYALDSGNVGQVVQQSIAADTVVDPEAAVDLRVAVELSAPVITGPTGVLPADAGGSPTLEWEATDSPVGRWQVTWSQEQCVIGFPDGVTSSRFSVIGCEFPDAEGSQVVATTSYAPPLEFDWSVPEYGAAGQVYTGWVQWQVAPLDDTGQAGPASEPAYFRVAVS